VLIRMLAAPTAREQARRALVAISDGQDYGPHDPRASREEVAAAQELWAMYWSDEGLAAADRRSPDA
jgi:hypothetical protein